MQICRAWKVFQVVEMFLGYFSISVPMPEMWLFLRRDWTIENTEGIKLNIPRVVYVSYLPLVVLPNPNSYRMGIVATQTSEG
jgi:hypothetical protein